MRSFCIVALALCVAGCVTQKVVWDKPGATPASFELDKNQCIYEATLGTPTATYTPSVGAAIAQGIAEGMRQNQLQTLCMKARGYEQRVIQVDSEAPPPVVTASAK